MLRATFNFEGITVEAISSTGTRTESQDRWLVQEIGDTLRVAVVDGVTPWRNPMVGVNAGSWAAATCVKYLSLPGSITSHLDEANTALHDPSIAPSRRQSMAAVAAVAAVALD